MKSNRESNKHLYFVIPSKKWGTRDTRGDRPIVITFKGDSTNQKELTCEAWNWLKENYPNKYRLMTEGAITIELSHDHPYKYWN